MNTLSESPPRHPVGLSLPRQLTSFVGRAREVAEIRALLARTRLLTLTGPGGVGKTRLALQAVAGLSDNHNPDGVWFVDLAPLADPALVARAIADAGGVAEHSGVPLHDTLTDAIGDHRILLVLDNCEHLVEACAQLADALLRACGALQILATSRELLGTSGEVTWPVPPLSLPPAEENAEAVAGPSSAAEAGAGPTAGAAAASVALARFEAIRLFAERAAAARPDFELTDANAAAVARICRRLDGLPLALELAAARLRALSPEQLATRLDDRFQLLTGGNRAAVSRHQTLAAAVTWSYDLLDEAESALFRRLSVFAGGWTLGAAEAVCGSAIGDDSSPVLDTLARLVDQSLVLADAAGEEVRYRFLETIRQYAFDRLHERSVEAEMVRQAHALHFLAVAESAEPRLYEADAQVLLTQLASEHDNLRACLRWALDSRQTELALRLAASLYRFWRQRGYVREARGWLAQALDVPGDPGTEDRAVQFARARALNAAGVLARDAGDFAAARPLQADSVRLFEVLGDAERLTNAEQNLGQVLLRLGDRESARKHLESSRERMRHLDSEALGRSASLFPCLVMLSQIAMQDGDHIAARAYLVEAEAYARTVGSPHIVAQALTHMGVLEVQLGEHAAGGAALREALRLAASAGDSWSTFQALHGLASAAALEVRPTSRFSAQVAVGRTSSNSPRLGPVSRQPLAAEALGAAIRAAVLTAAFEVFGGRAGIRNTAEDSVLETQLRNTIANLDPATRSAAEAKGAAMTTPEAVAYALLDDGIADPPAKAVALLSPREQEVARLMARGYTNRQMAEELVIAEPTAERHAANIFFKLGVHSRAQVAAWAAEHLHTGM